MTVMQKRFHLNGHTLGFHPQTQKLEPPYVQHNKQYHRKVLLSSVHLNGHAHYSQNHLVKHSKQHQNGNAVLSSVDEIQ